MNLVPSQRFTGSLGPSLITALNNNGSLNGYLYQYLFRPDYTTLVIAITCGSWTTPHLVAIFIQNLCKTVNHLFRTNGERQMYEALAKEVFLFIHDLWPCHQFLSCI